MERFDGRGLRAVLDCLAPWPARDGIHETTAALRDLPAAHAWRSAAIGRDSALADEHAAAATADHLGALQEQLMELADLLARLDPDAPVGTTVEHEGARTLTVGEARSTIVTAIDAMMPALDVLHGVRKSMLQHRGRMPGPPD